jgi:1-acyl-sn-glycerol-3-phosphate acyltransferase
MNRVWMMGRAVARLLSTLGWDLKTYGLHNVPLTGGVLLVANHQSYLDPIFIGAHPNRMTSYLARHGLFTNRYFSWLIRGFNAFPIRQGEGDLGAIRETVRRLQEGHMLTIFPEGARTADGELGKIEPGAALVIRKAGVPVVPVGIEGAFHAWKKTRRFPRTGLVRVMYGKPIYDLHTRRPNEINAIIERELRSLIHQLRSMDHWDSP